MALPTGLRTDPWNLIRIIPAEENFMKKNNRMTAGRGMRPAGVSAWSKTLCAAMLFGAVVNTSMGQDVVHGDADSNWHKERQRKIGQLEKVIVSSSRVDNKTPLTTTMLNRDQLDDAKIAVSMPYMLELEPSVVVTGENGPTGETKISIRGVSASRINVNINGITLNDAESQEVFWYNIPNLGGMAQSLQIQRGVGASTGGSPSFGASMNLQTMNASSRPYAHVDLGYGSWNTLQQGITAGTGLTQHGLSFDMAYNNTRSDGFIRGSGADQQSLFLSGGYYGERSILKAVFIMGHQTTGITWNGATEAQLDADRLYNPAGEYYDESGNVHYYDNENDNYNQRHYQLYYSYLASDRLTFNAAFDFTHGDGYYENYRYNKKVKQYGLTLMNGNTKDDFIHRKDMYSSTYTGTFSAKYRNKATTFDFGETFVYHTSDHMGNLVWSKDSVALDGEYLFVDRVHPYEWYRNEGVKKDNTFYAKMNRDFTERFNVYAEAQLRTVDYSLYGTESDREDIDFREHYLFFNPKLGVNYLTGENSRLYFVAGVISREPTRSDIKETYLEGDTIKAETMLDFELGYSIKHDNFSFSANAYAMLYRDQLTPSGNYSPSGYALMENVDKSYRIGLELVAGYRISRLFSIDGNLTVSTNRIVDYSCMVTTDDWSDKQLVNFGNTDLSLSPSLVGAVMGTFRPFRNTKVQLIGKYVGIQYADNSSREEMKVDPYFLLNLRVSHLFQVANGNDLECQLAVNNLLNTDYRLSAYASSTIDPATGAFTFDRTYFQQPGINFMARVIYRF